MEMAIKVLNHLVMPSTNRSADAAPFHVDIRHEQNYNVVDPLIYVQSYFARQNEF